MKKSGTTIPFPKHRFYFPEAKNFDNLFCTLYHVSVIFLKYLFIMFFIYTL